MSPVSGVQDVDDRIGRLEDLIERCLEEIARLNVRKTRAQQIVTNAHRAQREAELAASAPPAAVRDWARTQGIEVGKRGRIPAELREKYLAAVGGSGVRTEATASVRHPDQGRDSDRGADSRTTAELEAEIEAASA